MVALRAQRSALGRASWGRLAIGEAGMDRAAITGIIGAVAGAVAVAVAALATGWFGFASKDEELRVHLVEIAIGILRVDPCEGLAEPMLRATCLAKEDVTRARAWAIEVIEKNSGVNFTPADRAALLSKPILTKDFGPHIPRY
jgi:hypothetical protein